MTRVRTCISPPSATRPPDLPVETRLSLDSTFLRSFSAIFVHEAKPQGDNLSAAQGTSVDALILHGCTIQVKTSGSCRCRQDRINQPSTFRTAVIVHSARAFLRFESGAVAGRGTLGS